MSGGWAGAGVTRVELLVRGSKAGAGIGGTDAVADQKVWAVLPASSESYEYDGAGRLEEDSLWNYTWNGMGRLVSMERKAGTGPAPELTSETIAFVYDTDGHRTLKTRTRAYEDAPDKVETSKVYWSDWLPVCEEISVDGGTASRRWFVWGQDVSGSWDGAGGIGGLLAIREEGGRTLLPVHDGLGNITALIHAGTGDTVATYDYAPFGEIVAESGEVNACPFRYQSKFYDSETGLSYFGFRYYSAKLGRWISRDPLGEDGGFNLYAYCANDPVNGWDYLGMETRVISGAAPVLFVHPSNPNFVMIGFPTEENGWIGPFKPNGKNAIVPTGIPVKKLPYVLSSPDFLNSYRGIADDELSAEGDYRIARNGMVTVFYVQNVGQVAGGFLEAAGGVVLAPETGGVSLVLVVHGADVSGTALTRLWEGPDVDVQSNTSQALQFVGLSRSDAEFVDNAIPLVVGGTSAYVASKSTVLRYIPPTQVPVVPKALQLQKQIAQKANRTGEAIDRWLMNPASANHARYGRWAQTYRSIMTNPNATAQQINFAKGVRGRFLDRRMSAWMESTFRDQYPTMRLDLALPGSKLRPDVYFPSLEGRSVIFDFGGPSKINDIMKYSGKADDLIPIVPISFF